MVSHYSDSKTGVAPLSIDTNIKPSEDTVTIVSPVDPHSPSPLPQIRKLDLHPTAEDDASSETSSTAPSKPPHATQNTIFDNFSPRSSLDIREPEGELPILPRGQNQTRRLPRSPLSRTSDLGPKAEILLMGYAQVTGNFMIDDPLINPTEFDEVKSRAVMGGKSAGGVIGVDIRRSSAPWTALPSLGNFSSGLGNFGLGSFFGAAQPSSLAEMRDRAASKAVPVLSTPPSILFVDIRLLPGESRSFSYTFKLPTNLPPSHRGRALRISYSLVITTQRPGKSGQHLSTAEIPFRLFSHIDGFSPYETILIVEKGRQPKYDLKSPVILLQDEAKTHSLADGEVPPSVLSTKPRPTIRRSSTYSDKPIESSQEEFMAFVDELLGSLGNVPLSATEPPASHLSVPPNPVPTPTREHPFKTSSCREALVSIVRKGAGAFSGGTKAKIGVYEIGKNGISVAKLTLPRTIFKLGETIEGIIDLEEGENVQCYQVHRPSYLSLTLQIRSALESAEEVDPTVSVRSQSSIHRATKRIHSSKVEFTTFARRVHFAFEIPTGVAPSFETSSSTPHYKVYPIS
jgi:RAB6A-GEF complex partner protein 2